jgi:hypothetical protein
MLIPFAGPRREEVCLPSMCYDVLACANPAAIAISFQALVILVIDSTPCEPTFAAPYAVNSSVNLLAI